MSNPLDEIQKQHDKVVSWWLIHHSDHEFSKARQQVGALLAALRAVESACATSEEHAAEYGDTASVYVDDVRAAIREALT